MRLPITLVVALGLILSTDAAAIPKKACKNPSLSPSKHYATVGPSSSLEPSATPKLYPASKPSSSSEPSATFEPYPTIKPYPTIELYPTSPSSGNATSSKTSTPCKSSTISYSSGSASESTHGTETPSATSSAASSKITESSSTPSETSTSISIVETSSATLEPPTSSDVIESPSTISESSQVTEASSSTSEVSISASETESSSLASSSFFSTSTEPSSPTLETSTSISETETPSITSSSISSTSIASSSTLTPSSPSCPTPLPTQVIADSSFEDGSDAWSWDGTAILAGSTGPTAVNPRTGARSFQGRGSAPQTPWTLNIRQTVSVAPGQTYNFEIWARQALPNVCTIYVNFDGEDVLLFTPASNAYSSFPASVEVAQSSSGTGDLLIQANCVRGGTTNRLWLDDVTMTLVPPKQVVVDPSFEASSSAWTFDGTGVLTSSTGPSTVNPHTGLRSFQGRGSTPQSPWTLNLRQTVSVVPGNTYSLEVFARQALPNVCIVTATFDGVGIMDFTPGTAAYASFSGPVQATGSCGELVLSANCIRGGATNRLWLDDITLTLVE